MWVTVLFFFHLLLIKKKLVVDLGGGGGCPLLSNTFRILTLDVELSYDADTLGMSRREPEAAFKEVVDNQLAYLHKRWKTSLNSYFLSG